GERSVARAKGEPESGGGDFFLGESGKDVDEGSPCWGLPRVMAARPFRLEGRWEGASRWDSGRHHPLMEATVFLACFVAMGSAGGPSFPQIGDSLDRRGEVQKSLVPKELIPPAPVFSPEEALRTFTVGEGDRLELAGSDPRVEEP